MPQNTTTAEREIAGTEAAPEAYATVDACAALAEPSATPEPSRAFGDVHRAVYEAIVSWRLLLEAGHPPQPAAVDGWAARFADGACGGGIGQMAQEIAVAVRHGGIHRWLRAASAALRLGDVPERTPLALELARMAVKAPCGCALGSCMQHGPDYAMSSGLAAMAEGFVAGSRMNYAAISDELSGLLFSAVVPERMRRNVADYGWLEAAMVEEDCEIARNAARVFVAIASHEIRERQRIGIR